ncbi:hypothetical protein CRE_27166 [Caenorhabditis remanei]|uniref:Serpentine receptor class gamma n=1 Tax=Caenorhabditis remanei TaxID=31234 RepID=E3LNU3_CAERE|nr:hypothetical protein CRE_27166 [Caenorhabditis remanei]
MSGHLAPCLMSTLGCVSSTIAAIIGFYNIYIVLSNPYFKKKYEYQMFFFRFIADFVMTGFSSVYYFLLIVSVHEGADENLALLEYWLGLIVSSSATVRVVTSFLIALERTLAIYFPILFKNYRSKIPKLLLPLFALSFGFIDNFILYVICGYVFTPNLSCIIFTCQINSCFLKYYSMNKTIMYGSTGTVLVALCTRLFIVNWIRSVRHEKLSRVNKLALIDAVIVLLFDFSSSFIAARGIFTYQGMGPYDAAPKMLGRAIEAFVVSIQLNRARIPTHPHDNTRHTTNTNKTPVLMFQVESKHQ